MDHFLTQYNYKISENDDRSQSPIDVASPMTGTNQSNSSRSEQTTDTQYGTQHPAVKRRKCESPDTDIQITSTHTSASTDVNSSLKRSISQPVISVPLKEQSMLCASRRPASPPVDHSPTKPSSQG